MALINKITIENQELKNKLLRLQDKLNINSSNSGLPSSKEVYRIERKSKPKSGRKAGGQKDINIVVTNLKHLMK